MNRNYLLIPVMVIAAFTYFFWRAADFPNDSSDLLSSATQSGTPAQTLSTQIQNILQTYQSLGSRQVINRSEASKSLLDALFNQL